MGYGLVTTVPPAAEPVTLAEAKSHLNVGHSDDDTLIAVLIAAAREQTQTETHRRWMPQTLVMSLADFPDRNRRYEDERSRSERDGVMERAILLPVEPVASVTAVRYYAQTGTLTALSSGTDYLTWLPHSPPIVYPAPARWEWPETQEGRLGAVEVEFVAGYANIAAVPAAAKHAILLAVGQWYEHRGDSDEPSAMGLPPAAIRLLRSLNTGLYS